MKKVLIVILILSSLLVWSAPALAQESDLEFPLCTEAEVAAMTDPLNTFNTAYAEIPAYDDTLEADGNLQNLLATEQALQDFVTDLQAVIEPDGLCAEEFYLYAYSIQFFEQSLGSSLLGVISTSLAETGDTDLILNMAESALSSLDTLFLFLDGYTTVSLDVAFGSSTLEEGLAACTAADFATASTTMESLMEEYNAFNETLQAATEDELASVFADSKTLAIQFWLEIYPEFPNCAAAQQLAFQSGQLLDGLNILIGFIYLGAQAEAAGNTELAAALEAAVGNRLTQIQTLSENLPSAVE